MIFSFDSGGMAEKYDGWSFYRNQFQNKCSKENKAVDFLYVRGKVGWLIEVKDYIYQDRNREKEKELPLSEEVAQKVRDSLAGLCVAQCNANDSKEKNFAKKFLKVKTLRVVLHVEINKDKRKLCSREKFLADTLDKMEHCIRAVDCHPKLISMGTMGTFVPWKVKSELSVI